jgi:hypothetical protein
MMCQYLLSSVLCIQHVSGCFQEKQEVFIVNEGARYREKRPVNLG